MKILSFAGTVAIACIVGLVATGCRRAGPAKPPEARRDAAVARSADPDEPAPPGAVALDPRDHDGHDGKCPCLALSAEALATADGRDRFDAWRREKPRNAAAWLARLPSTDPVLEAVDRAAVAWAESEPVQALDWAMQIENASLRVKALAAIGASWAERIGEATSLVSGDALGEGAARERAVADVVSRWARVDPESAAVWVAAFPTGELRAASSSKLVRLWSEHDPKSADAWWTAHAR
jgi:hypothetical protein